MLKHLLALGLAIALVQVLVAGPYLQLVASAINANEGSLYSSIYGEQVAPFLSWSDWVAATWYWPYILSAIATALGCGLGRNKKEFLLFGTLAAFAALSVMDFCQTGLNGFGLSLACNLAGGLLIAGWLYILAIGAATVASTFGDSVPAKATIAIAWPGAAGFVTSVTLYVLLRAFLHPAPVEMNVDVEVPFNGFYSADFDLGCYSPSRDTSNDEYCGKTGDERLSEQLKLPSKEETSFGLLSNFNDSKNFLWLGEAKPLQLIWQRKSAEESSATLNVAQGCIDLSALQRAATPLPGVKAKNIMRLDFGSGMFQARPIDDSAIARVEVQEKGFSQFSVSTGKSAPDTLTVSRFVADATILLRPNISGGKIEIGMWPLGENDWPVQRKLVQVVADGVATHIAFNAPKEIEPTAKVKCQAAQVGLGPIQVTSPYVSLVLVLSSKKSISYANLRQSDQVRISNVGGWVQVDRVSPKGLENFAHDGALHAIFLNGAFSKLEVDGKEVARSSRALLALYGNLDASVRDKTLTVSGKSVASYVNGRRMNMTRWEKLGDSFRLAILGGIPAFFAIFWRKLRKLFPKEQDPWVITRR